MKRYEVKREDGVDNWSILDRLTGETVDPERICEVLNLLTSSELAEAVASLKGGATAQ